MDSPISLSVTPVQAMIALAFQAWLIAFPVILIRKISRLEALMEAHFSSSEDVPEGQDNV
jgi:hypothetical protein